MKASFRICLHGRFSICHAEEKMKKADVENAAVHEERPLCGSI
ncbi:MAG: hypothetical protein Q4E89_00380 [Eubacteriales bacterium]|nr:hypothetical protein [Eubacteriales bacterium]